MPTQPVNRLNNGGPQRDTLPTWERPLAQCRNAVETSVEQNPVGTALAVFGLGLGIGTVVGSFLIGQASQRREHMALSVGRKVLDSMHEMIPDRVHQHLGG